MAVSAKKEETRVDVPATMRGREVDPSDNSLLKWNGKRKQNEHAKEKSKMQYRCRYFDCRRWHAVIGTSEIKNGDGLETASAKQEKRTLALSWLADK